MNKIDLKKIDLNLLLVFEVLMRKRSVTHAAEELGRTQSAISHALARLREQLGDPLLIKLNGVMQPSPLALTLIEEVRPILQTIKRVLTPQEAFVPQTSQRNFMIALSNFAPSLVTNLIKNFTLHAPFCTLEWRNLEEKVLAKVAEGQIDLCLAPSFLRLPEGVSYDEIGELKWACFVRQNHPVLSQDWNIKAWQYYPHIAVRTGDASHNPIALQSEQKGFKQRVAAWVPDFTAIAPAISQTDMIATMPQILMHGNLEHYNLVELPMPYAQQPISMRLYWASRYHKDPANMWLRQLVLSEFKPFL